MRYVVLSFLCAITLIAYVQRSAFNGVTKTIESELGISSSSLGLVMSGWYLTYALFQLPSGWLADRLGSKRTLILFAVGWSLLTGLAGLSNGFIVLISIWALMGAVQAGIFPCCTKAIGSTFPRTQQAFASGMLAACMSLGAALAPILTSRLIGPLAWQEIFALYAIPGLVWAVLFAFVVFKPDALSSSEPSSRENEAADWHALPAETETEKKVSFEWSKLVKDPQMLILCIQQFFRAGPMVIFFTWFHRVISETSASSSEAGWLASLPPLVGVFGGLLGGIVSDWLLKRTGNPRLARQGLTFLLLVIGSASALGAYLSESTNQAVVFMSIAGFCGMAGGVSGYSIAISYGGKHVASVFATMNMTGNLGATVFPFAAGWLADETGNWNNVLLLFAVMFAAGALCWTILNPRGTLFAEGEEQK